MSTPEKIKTLTADEINSLQVDAALRLLGEHTQHLSEINHNIAIALQAKLTAECELNALKSSKSTIINNMRALGTIANNS